MAESGSKGERELQKMHNTIKSASSFYNSQVLDYLNTEMQKFISEQEMVFLSTADAKGECDASFRAGPKSFIKVLDNHTTDISRIQGKRCHGEFGQYHMKIHKSG